MAHLRHGRSFGIRLEGGGDNGGYILRMYSGHSLVASHFGPNFFVLFWSLKKFGVVFLL